MQFGGLIEPELFSLFQALTQALIRYTPGTCKSASCVVEQAPGHGKGRLRYRIGPKDRPGEGTAQPSPELHEAAYRLFMYWTKDGGPFPRTEASVEQQPDGNWKSGVRKLDAGSGEGSARPEQTEEEIWQAVYRAREDFFATHVGPLPGDIQKLLNLVGVWPGGGIFPIEATRLGGMGVCTTFGLTNADMPARVRLARYERADRPGGGPGFSAQVQARVPRWVPSERAGYGYEVMVLTRTPTTWPLLTLGWLIQMEILNDLDLLGRVEEAQGVTVEAVKIGDGSRFADFLIEPALAPVPAEARLPNGTMRLLVATRITRDEMNFALEHGRPALMERLVQAGVGQVSDLERASVVG